MFVGESVTFGVVYCAYDRWVETHLFLYGTSDSIRGKYVRVGSRLHLLLVTSAVQCDTWTETPLVLLCGPNESFRSLYKSVSLGVSHVFCAV